MIDIVNNMDSNVINVADLSYDKSSTNADFEILSLTLNKIAGWFILKYTVHDEKIRHVLKLCNAELSSHHHHEIFLP